MMRLFVITLCVMLPQFILAQGTYEQTISYATQNYPAKAIENIQGEHVVVGSMSTATNGIDIYLHTLDDEGNTLSVKTFGTSNDEYAKSFIQLPDSGYAITGYIQSGAISTRDGFLLRIDKNGT